MSLGYELAARYARALGKAVTDDAQLLPTRYALEELSEALQENRGLYNCLASPAVALAKRQRVLDDVLASMGAPPETRRLAHEVLARGRIAMLAQIATAFGVIVDERLNQVTARVVSARPLGDEARRQVQDTLERYSGKTVFMRCRVDPELIGGLVVRMAGRVLDGSLRRRLRLIREALLAQEV
jgi:F-type H+-transporting ATPase subunit delta